MKMGRVTEESVIQKAKDLVTKCEDWGRRRAKDKSVVVIKNRKTRKESLNEVMPEISDTFSKNSQFLCMAPV